MSTSVSALSRGLQTTIALLIAALALPFAASAATKERATPFFDNKSDTSPSAQPSWMSWVPDSVAISRLSIPGTHDSVAIHGGDAAQTQALCGKRKAGPDKAGCDLAAQLNAGVRFLDLRLVCESQGKGDNRFQYLEAYHGPTLQKVPADTELATITAFLKAHPTETVIAGIKNEGVSKPKPHQDCGSNSAAGVFVSGRYFTNPAYPFWQPTAADRDANNKVKPPTLGAVRGKIVAVDHFGLNGQDSTISDHDGHYLSPDHYKVCPKPAAGTCPFPTGAHPFDGKPDDNTLSIPQKLSEISQHLRKATDQAPDDLNGTFISAAWDGYYFPYDWASGINVTDFNGFNRATADDLWPTGPRTAGIVASDFPGPGLIDLLIARNLVFTENINRGGQAAGVDSSYKGAQRGFPGLAAQLGGLANSFAGEDTRKNESQWQSFIDGVLAAGTDEVDVISYRNSTGAAVVQGGDSLAGAAPGDSVTTQVVDPAGPPSTVSIADYSATVQQTLAAGQPTKKDAGVKAVSAALTAKWPGTRWAVAATTKAADNYLTVHFVSDHTAFLGPVKGITYVASGYDAQDVHMSLAVSNPAPHPGDQVTFRADSDIPAPTTAGQMTVQAVDEASFTPFTVCTMTADPAKPTSYVCTVTWPSGRGPAHYASLYQGGGYRNSTSQNPVRIP